MLDLVKPKKLCKGDKIAAVSLSWGGAGDEFFLWRYEVGKKRLLEDFGLEVVEMPNTLKGSAFLYEHPEKRAEDLMRAFADPSIKGIFTCIGGQESIRLLPYIDFDVIKNNPKVFLGYSDTTVAHFMCLKGGLSSFYGPSILAEFAENIQVFDYTKKWVQKNLFDSQPIGQVAPSDVWTSERIEWLQSNQGIAKKMERNSGYELLQGSGSVCGRLVGGCIEVLEFMKGTDLWNPGYFDDAILFLETSEDMPDPVHVERCLRNYGAQGILQKVKGILWGKPCHHKYYEEYKTAISKVVKGELGLDTPVLYNVNFGHTEPKICLPYGALAEINCEHAAFSILESGVTE